MLRKILLICLFVLPLFSCSYNDEKVLPENLTYIDDFKNEDLPKPNLEISSKDEFKYALDYLTFYGINQKVYFKISDSYKDDFYNIYQEFLATKKITEIADVFQVDLDRNYYDKFSLIGLEVFYNNDFASLNPENPNYNSIFIYEHDYLKDLNKRDSNFNDFKLYKKNNGHVKVSNSEQLFYALENDYLPICEEDSNAETIFEEMKSVLRRIAGDDMDEITKIKQIYNFLTSEVRYDVEISQQSNADIYKSKSYYLDGVFLNRYAVCDGKAKSFVALCRLEGIEAYRVTDFDDSFSGHSYNYVKADDKYYLVCTTYGSNRINDGENEFVVPSYNMFLTTLETCYQWEYDSEMFESIKEQIVSTSYDFFNNDELVISNPTQLTDYIKNYQSDNELRYKKFEFVINDCSVEEIMKEAEKTFENNFMFLSEKGINREIYSLFFY